MVIEKNIFDNLEEISVFGSSEFKEGVFTKGLYSALERKLLTHFEN